MPGIIILTQDERLFLQDIVNEMYQNDSIRSLEPGLLKGILTKLEVASGTLSVSFESVENERLQYVLEQMNETVRPYPVPFIPRSERDDTQINLIASIRSKLQTESE